MRWTVAIVLGFLLMFLADGLFIWLAVSGAEDLDPSYTTERP